MLNNDNGLSIVPADGGRPVVIARPDVAKRETYLVFPSVLPDGRGVLFVAEDGGGRELSLNVLEVDTKRRTQVMAGGGSAVALAEGVLVYAAEGSLFAAPFDIAGRRIGAKPERLLPDVLMELPFEPGLGHFAIGGDGTLAYLAGDARSFLGGQLAWVDSAGGQALIANELRRPASAGGGPLAATGPRWSPRGERVVFYSQNAERSSNLTGFAGDVWVLDVRSGAVSKVFPESR